MPYKLTRVPINIAGFDSLIEGGFKRGSVNLVAGGAGSGKTIFALQFLVNGIKNYNEPGIYITFEEKKKKLYEDMTEFGWDLEKYEKEGKFVFLEYTPEQVKKVLVEGGGIIDSLVHKMKAKRLVIDSITSFVLLYKDELAKKESSLALFELINKWDCTAVLTSQSVVSGADIITESLEFEVDGIILLYYIKHKGVRRRGLEILKMRGTKHPGKTFAFKIDRNGIIVDPQEVVVFKS